MLIELIKKYLTIALLLKRSNLIGLVLWTMIALFAIESSYALSSDKEMLVIPPLQDNNHISSLLPEYVVIQPTDQVTYSSEIAASVAEIFVKEGSSFQNGDVLLIMDCRVQDADLKKAQAQLEASSSAFESAKKLKNYGSISEIEYLQAEAQDKMAKADVDKLKAIVDKCIIKAPFNGAVSKLNVHLHETIKPGDPLLKIISVNNIDFVLQVPSIWLAWLHVGTEFEVHINEINKSVKVRVYKINPEIDSVSQTVKIIAKEAAMNHDPSLLPGMSGQATFPDRKQTTTSKNM